MVRRRPTPAVFVGRGTTTPRETRKQSRQRSGCFSFGRSPALSLENASSAPEKDLLKGEVGAEWMETVYKEAESHQGDPFLSGALGEERGGEAGTGPKASRSPTCASSLLPQGHHYLVRSCRDPLRASTALSEGGLGTLGLGYLTALMGSVVEELFPSNAFLKNRRVLIVPIPVKRIRELSRLPTTPGFREVPTRFHFFFFSFLSFFFFFFLFFFFNVLQIIGNFFVGGVRSSP